VSEPAFVSKRQEFPGGLVVLLLHAIVGPPLGALTIWAGLFVHFLIQGTPSPGWSENPFSLLGYFALFSYVLGGPQAFLCGLCLGVRTLQRGRYTYLECVAAAIGAEIVVALLTRRQQLMPQFLESLMYYGALGIVAALILRALMPRLSTLFSRRH
jgi:hypothetical protein